uniref:Uncharacterized protein n=1 Tax=Cuerna arida TaxID=1464854 RepID=A0A1B6F4G3_9HEMI
MLLRSVIVVSSFTLCLGDMFELIVKKDEQVKRVLAEPQGTDSELFESMRFFTDSIYRLIRELRIGKKSAFGVSKRLYDRGYPALLSQLFYIEKLKAYFNWVESDVRYFYSLYSDVKKRWVTFETLALQL